MKAQTETNEPQLLGLLKPIIEVVEKFEGHINYSYLRRHDSNAAGAEYIPFDMKFKSILRNQLQPLVDAAGLLMGAGAGHIWVAQPSACCFDPFSSNYKKGVAVNGIHDRILLITD